jgi:RNase P subunit RPR2
MMRGMWFSMGLRSHVFVLDRNKWSFHYRVGSCFCRRCGFDLFVGDRVVSRGAGRNRSVVYHVKCWEAGWFEF